MKNAADITRKTGVYLSFYLMTGMSGETKKDTEPKCMLKNNEDFYEMPFLCTTCGMCSNICPVGIKLREILLLIRQNSEQPVNNLRMFKYIEKYGNPFGDKGKEVEELYCC